MGRLRACAVCALLMTCAAPAGVRTGSPAQASGSFAVRLAGSVAKEPLDGRLLLLFSKDPLERAALPGQRDEPVIRRRSSASTSRR